MASKDLLNRDEREVREMFMIDRIKLILLHELKEVREFHGNKTRRLQ